ncbi:MAG: hypothetical protein Q9209_005184 [Squamulea sp. 1 TL-2023]
MPSNARPRPAGLKNTAKLLSANSTSSNGPSQEPDLNTQQSNNPYAQLDQSNHNDSSPSASQVANHEKQTVNGISGSPPLNAAPNVNRKKQKRREKQAARIAAEQKASTASRATPQAANGAYQEFTDGLAEPPTALNGFTYGGSEYDDADRYEPAEGEDLYYTDDDGHLYERSFDAPQNGFLPHPPIPQQSAGRKSKKRTKGKNESPNHSSATREGYLYNHPPPPPPPPQMSGDGSAHQISKDRIWNTSTAEERERIKEFWLSLGEEDRRSLVKVEKEAVLKKMKEQQKHSCSCTVCGRKRTAIEEELEVLYDAYYEELEQYANHQQISLVDGVPIMSTTRLHHSTSRFPPSRNVPPIDYQRVSRGRIQEISHDEEEVDDEEYSEEDEDEEFSDDEPEEEPVEPKASDFFNFGNSLTVQGGILTVADDLLKNDGKKFIEMMEQLAERRMQREEDAQYAAAAGLSHPAMQPHNHGPPPEDDAYDEEDDEDSYESGDEDYEDDEMETMTEEQRMEEGRRMFQIFAARMFEQRVLTAYREKVAAERQKKLIEELEEESRLDTQREAKKAKEAQKKKDKKRQLKMKQDEEKAQREAKKAADEAAARVVEEKKLEEQRQKKEEQRKKKEAEKKVQEDERQRKEAEKQKRLQDAREQQAEQERKQREQKEREKKKKEEARKKERDEREAKDKAAAEKKERETAEKREQEAIIKAERELKEKAKKQEQAAKTPSNSNTPLLAEIPNPKPTRPPAPTRSSHASPHLQIATPAVPKAPTPFRPRQPSFQDSHVSSPKTSKAPSTSSTTSPGPPHSNAVPGGNKAIQALPQQQHQIPHYHQVSSSSTAIHQPPGLPPMPAVGANSYPSNFGPMLPSGNQRVPLQDSSFTHQPPLASPQQRHFMPPPGGLPFPPGINGIRHMPPGTQGPPGQPFISQSSTNAQYVISRDTMPSHSRTHSRQTSTSYETSVFETPNIPAMTQPIARPAPIQRPSSATPQQQSDKERPGRSEIDDLANHLGSSALLDDTDVPLTSASNNHPRRGSVAPGGPFRQGFGASPMFPDPMSGKSLRIPLSTLPNLMIVATKVENFQRGSQGGNGTHWGGPHMPFGAPQMAGSPQWTQAPGDCFPAFERYGD